MEIRCKHESQKRKKKNGKSAKQGGQQCRETGSRPARGDIIRTGPRVAVDEASLQDLASAAAVLFARKFLGAGSEVVLAGDDGDNDGDKTYRMAASKTLWRFVWHRAEHST